jgi:hypothetical protein
MLYIIGVNHRAQVRERGNEDTYVQRELARHLRTAVKDFQLSFIAEEYYEELLDRRCVDSISREIALEFGIAHKFCNPNVEELHEIGCLNINSICLKLMESDEEDQSERQIRIKAGAILTGRYSPIRERFWLDRLREFCGRDGLFICGDAHIDSFCRLLDVNQIAWNVIARGIGFVQGEADEIQEATQYLRDHPELADWNP